MKPHDIRREQDRRLGELMAIARQRFLDAGGDPRHPPSGLKGDDYMLEVDEKHKMLTPQELGDLASYVKIIREKMRHNPDAPLNSVSHEIGLMYGMMDNLKQYE